VEDRGKLLPIKEGSRGLSPKSSIMGEKIEEAWNGSRPLDGSEEKKVYA